MSEPLSLYRSILRLGRRQLKLTDQEFFRKIVRTEFNKYKDERNAEEIEFQIEVKCVTIPYPHVIQMNADSILPAL